MRFFIWFSTFIILSASVVNAQTTSESPLDSPEITTPEEGAKDNLQNNNEMSLEQLTAIVRAIDENAEVRGPAMRLTIAEVAVTVITDPPRNRMRAFVAIRSLDGVNQQLLYRMLQANFDSALDARYAIAQEHILSVFVHPLKELQKDQFIEGLGQVVNLVKTYGTAFTSGGMTFGGGDSRDLHRKLIDELLKKGEQI